MTTQEVTQQPATIIAAVAHYVTVNWQDQTKSPARLHKFDCQGLAFAKARELQQREPDARVMVWTPDYSGGLISYPKNDWASA